MQSGFSFCFSFFFLFPPPPTGSVVNIALICLFKKSGRLQTYLVCSACDVIKLLSVVGWGAHQLSVFCTCYSLMVLGKQGEREIKDTKTQFKTLTYFFFKWGWEQEGRREGAGGF